MDIDTDTDERRPNAAVAEQDQRPECLICLEPLENDIAVFVVAVMQEHTFGVPPV